MMNGDAARVIVVGCGHVGTRVALREQALGAGVLGSYRREGRDHELRRLGIEPLHVDLDAADTVTSPRWQDSRVYFFVPPGAADPGDERARRLIEAFGTQRPRVVVMISTTGVYGDCGGDWVDETAPARPATGRSCRRLAAEQTLLDWAGEQQVPLAVLRVAGIYGPGRLPVERLKRGDPVLDPAVSGFTNRIHVDDLVRTCMAAARRCRAPRIYNVADGEPGTMSDYFLQLADALGIARPPLVDRAEARRIMTPAMLAYLDESRRIDNRRLREELEVELDFTCLEDGLRQAIALSDLDGSGEVRVLVCVNRRLGSGTPSCAGRDSEALADQLQQEIDLRGLNLGLQRLHCLGRCEQGPNVRIAPGGRMFHGVTVGDCERILELAGAFASSRER